MPDEKKIRKARLAVVMINYGTPDLVRASVETIVPEIGDQDRIVIVDNNSPDGSGLLLKKWVDTELNSRACDVILSEENHGFSGGNNLGINACDAEYYLLINSDTLVRAGAITTLLNFFEENRDSKIGLLTPRLEWEDGTPQISCFRYHSPVSELIFAASTNLITRIFSRFDVPIPVCDTSRSYDWSSFACIMIKSDVIKEVGLMDEGYFLYYEDVDYCKMAANAGWNTVNVPAAHVVHLRGGSSPVKSNITRKKRLPQYYYASRTRYFHKHYGKVGLLAANVLWTLGACIDSLKTLITRKPSKLCEKQYRDTWFGFAHPLRKYRP